MKIYSNNSKSKLDLIKSHSKNYAIGYKRGKMKQTLKLVTCLLLVLTLALGINLSSASASNAICDTSASPTCRVVLNAGECQDVPLPGYHLEQIETMINPRGAIDKMYPPPKMIYSIDLSDAKVESELPLKTKATYDFDPLDSDFGKVCNVNTRTTSLVVFWKNTPKSE